MSVERLEVCVVLRPCSESVGIRLHWLVVNEPSCASVNATTWVDASWTTCEVVKLGNCVCVNAVNQLVLNEPSKDSLIAAKAVVLSWVTWVVLMASS